MILTRREWIRTLGLGGGLIFLTFLNWGCARRSAENTSPNLLFVFTDQHRKQAVGFMGEDPVITPNLDRLAAEGVAFTNAVSTCPICSPFRAMLMTGRYPMSTGITSNCMPGTDLCLDSDELCIGDVLKAHGYSTGYIGKWHLEVPSLNRSPYPPDSAVDAWDGWTPPGPRRHGFDFWYAYNSNARHFHPNYWAETADRIDIDQWSVTHETDMAIRFIENRDPEKPFALFMSWNPPHNPYVAPEHCLELYEEETLPPRPNVTPDSTFKGRYKAYLAAVSSCDEQFGRLMACLERNHLSEKTVVVFTSDHGEMMASHGRYAKSVWYEESTGVPFIVRWTGKIDPAREEMPFACYDFMPTLLGLMEIPVPASVEGTDYSGVITGGSGRRASSAVIAGYGNPGRLLAAGQPPSVWALRADSLRRAGVDWRLTGYRGLRTKRYTYVVQRGSDGNSLRRYLYDNREDPYQLNPLLTTHAEEDSIMARLDGELQLWLLRMDDPFPL